MWACAPSIDRASDAPVAASGLIAALLWARLSGLLRPRGWPNTLLEGLLLYVGATCLANLLLFMVGTAPWWAHGG